MQGQVPACRPVPNIDYAKEDLGTSCHLASRLCLPPSFTAAHSSRHLHMHCFKKALNTLLLFSSEVPFLL